MDWYDDQSRFCYIRTLGRAVQTDWSKSCKEALATGPHSGGLKSTPGDTGDWARCARQG